jgi:hypothetical protein
MDAYRIVSLAGVEAVALMAGGTLTGIFRRMHALPATPAPPAPAAARRRRRRRRRSA